MGPPCPLVFQMSFSSLQTSFGPRNTRNHVQAQGDAQEVPRRPIFLATVTCSREDGDSLGSGLAEGGDYRHVVSQTDCSFLHYCDRLARGAGFWPCTVDSARPASRSHMSQGTLASASKRSGRHMPGRRNPGCYLHRARTALAGGQRGLPWQTHERRRRVALLHPNRGHGEAAAAGRVEQVPANCCLPGGKEHGAQRSVPCSGNEVFALLDRTETGQCPVAITGTGLFAALRLWVRLARL